MSIWKRHPELWASRRLFCLGSLVVLDVLCGYLRYKIENNKNRCLKLDKPVTTCIGNGCYLVVACNDSDGVLFCVVLFSHEMSWMRSGTKLSQFLRIFLPILSVRSR